MFVVPLNSLGHQTGRRLSKFCHVVNWPCTDIEVYLGAQGMLSKKELDDDTVTKLILIEDLIERDDAA